MSFANTCLFGQQIEANGNIYLLQENIENLG